MKLFKEGNKAGLSEVFIDSLHVLRLLKVSRFLWLLQKYKALGFTTVILLK